MTTKVMNLIKKQVVKTTNLSTSNSPEPTKENCRRSLNVRTGIKAGWGGDDDALVDPKLDDLIVGA